MNDLSFQDKLAMFTKMNNQNKDKEKREPIKFNKSSTVSISERISTLANKLNHNKTTNLESVNEIEEENPKNNHENPKPEKIKIGPAPPQENHKKGENFEEKKPQHFQVDDNNNIQNNKNEENIKNKNQLTESQKEKILKEREMKRKEIEDYQTLIDTNPDELFKEITQERIKNWENLLFQDMIVDQLKDDSEILNTVNNHVNQKVIKNDVARTRVRESILVPSFTEYLEFFITYYCKQNSIKYKQGLNEIIGLFILLKYKIKISLSEIYNLIQAFVNKFLTNYYREEKLTALNSSLSLLTLLLKYHIPLIYNILDYAMILPQMYATSWILTLFSNKFRIDIMYHLWDHLIQINDNLFMHYIIVAFLQYNSNKITGNDIAQIPSVMTGLTIESTEELDKIIEIAFTIRYNTPYSFRFLCNNLQIFVPNSTELEKAYNTYKPDTMTALPMFPSEVFYITYKEEVKCPDEQCEHSSDNLFSLMNKPFYHRCEHCEMEVYKNINYIFFDLRILEYGSFENSDEKTGFLPKMIMVEQDELKKENFAKNTAERFIGDKGNYHFVFMTNKTDYFKDYEDNYYEEKEEEMDNFLKLCSVQTKVNKELNKTKTEKISLKEQYKLKEYDNLKKLLVALLKFNYPYVSFVYGGFHAIHDLSIKYEISLLNHDPNCDICVQNRKTDTSWTIFSIFKSSERKHTIKQNQKKLPEEKKEEKIKTPAPEPAVPCPLYDDTTPPETNIPPPSQRRKTINNLSEKINILQITKMIQDSDFSVNICTLTEYKEKIYTKKAGNQIMLIMDQEDLYIYKVSKPSNINPEDEEKFGADIMMESELSKLDKMKIKDIKNFELVKKKKNVLQIDYVQLTNSILSKTPKEKMGKLIIDFINENDSKKFVFTLTQYKKIPQENELVPI